MFFFPLQGIESAFDGDFNPLTALGRQRAVLCCANFAEILGTGISHKGLNTCPASAAGERFLLGGAEDEPAIHIPKGTLLAARVRVPSPANGFLDVWGKMLLPARGRVGVLRRRHVGITPKSYTDMYLQPTKQEVTQKPNSFPDFFKKTFLLFETEFSLFYRKFCCPSALTACFTTKLHDIVSENKMGTIDVCLISFSNM